MLLFGPSLLYPWTDSTRIRSSHTIIPLLLLILFSAGKMDCAEGKSNGGESYVITVYFNPWNVAVLSSKGGRRRRDRSLKIISRWGRKPGLEVTNVSIEIEGVGSITWEWLMSDNSTDWPEFAWIRPDNSGIETSRSRPFSSFDKWKLISYRWLPYRG